MPERKTLTPRRRCAVLLGAAVSALGGLSAQADNAALQALFFDACANPSGALAERCAETPGGLGDLSGDSESSLNPSQTLGATAATGSLVRERAERARRRDGHPAGDGEDTAGAVLDLGPFSLLINGHGAREDRDRTVDVDAERGYTLDVWGAELGLDYRFSPAVVAGAMVTWETSDLDFDRELPGVGFEPRGRAGSVTQDSLGIAGFASVAIGDRGYLDLSAGYVDSDYTLERRAVFQESQRLAPQTLVRTRGTPDGSETWAAIAAGYAASRGGWSLAPHLGLTYSRARVDGYRERDLAGTGLAMDVGGQTSRSLLGRLGVRVSRAVSRPGYVLLPQLNVEYLREFEADGPDTTVSYALDQAANTLTLRADDRDRDYLHLGVGLTLLLPNGWMPFLEYRTTLGLEDVDRDRIALGLRVEL